MYVYMPDASPYGRVLGIANVSVDKSILLSIVSGVSILNPSYILGL